MKGKILIGALAKAGKCKVQTVRYYEKLSLLPAPRRTSGNQRVYTPEHLELLTFIRHCRKLGFSLKQIKRFLELGDDQEQSCEEVDRISRQCLADVEKKIVRLQALQMDLNRIISSCKGGGVVADCQIIRSLLDHKKCLNDDHGGEILDEI